MSPTANISDELTHGPAEIFVAAAGSPEPTLADVGALRAGTFPGYKPVGKTSTPVVRTYTPEYRQVRSTQAARADANLIIGEEITVGSTLLQVTYDRLREATNADVVAAGGPVPVEMGFFVNGTVDGGEGDATFTITIDDFMPHTVVFPDGTYETLEEYAAAFESAVRGAVPGGLSDDLSFHTITSPVEVVVVTYSGPAGTTITFENGNGSPLIRPWTNPEPWTETVASVPESRLLRPRGIGKAAEYALAVVGPFGTGQSLTTAERVSITSAVELSDTREEETKLAVTWTVLEGDYALHLPADA